MDIHSVTHLLLSISLFSFIFSYSIFSSCLIHSFKVYLSTLYGQILSKNCIFLIFNGILVFLAKTSGFMKFFREKSEPNEPPSNLFPEKEVLEENIGVQEENHDLNLMSEVKEMDVGLEDEANGEEKGDVNNVQDAEDYELNFVTTEKEEEEEQDECNDEDDDDTLSSEDLNKKFDDFIRRMKEGFIIGAQQDFRNGAQQQLVMAY